MRSRNTLLIVLAVVLLGLRAYLWMAQSSVPTEASASEIASNPGRFKDSFVVVTGYLAVSRAEVSTYYVRDEGGIMIHIVLDVDSSVDALVGRRVAVSGYVRVEGTNVWIDVVQVVAR